MIDNKDSKIRYRADKLIEDYMQNEKGDENFIADGLSFEEMKRIIDDEGIVSCKWYCELDRYSSI